MVDAPITAATPTAATPSHRHRADTSGYNPDGKGPLSGTSVLTVAEGDNGVRWVAIASIKTKNPDNPAYTAQRDALVKGFHAGFP